MQLLAFGGERIFLAFFWGKVGQFANGVAQPFFFALRAGDCFARGGQTARGIAPGGPGGGGGAAFAIQGTESIQQPGMCGGVGKAHLFMLALHFHQCRAQTFEQGNTDRLVIDEGAGFAIGLQHAAQHQFIFGADALVAQNVETRVIGAWQKGGGNTCLCLPRAHQPCFGAVAERKAQAIQQYGFPGACFAGEHCEPGIEAQVELFNQHHIANGQRGEHRRAAPCSENLVQHPAYKAGTLTTGFGAGGNK